MDIDKVDIKYIHIQHSSVGRAIELNSVSVGSSPTVVCGGI